MDSSTIAGSVVHQRPSRRYYDVTGSLQKSHNNWHLVCESARRRNRGTMEGEGFLTGVSDDGFLKTYVGALRDARPLFSQQEKYIHSSIYALNCPPTPRVLRFKHHSTYSLWSLDQELNLTF